MTEVTTFICPRCQNRCIRSMHSGDFEHACVGDEALANESVFVIGNWTDYTGEDNNVGNALLQGQDNTLQGTRADLEGDKFQERDSNGFPVDRFRRRQHIESIPVEFFKGKSMKAPRDPQNFEDISF